MGIRGLSVKSVAIVLALVIGITFSPLKSNAQSIDNDHAHGVALKALQIQDYSLPGLQLMNQCNQLTFFDRFSNKTVTSCLSGFVFLFC